MDQEHREIAANGYRSPGLLPQVQMRAQSEIVTPNSIMRRSLVLVLALLVLGGWGCRKGQEKTTVRAARSDVNQWIPSVPGTMWIYELPASNSDDDLFIEIFMVIGDQQISRLCETLASQGAGNLVDLSDQVHSWEEPSDSQAVFVQLSHLLWTDEHKGRSLDSRALDPVWKDIRLKMNPFSQDMGSNTIEYGVFSPAECKEFSRPASEGCRIVVASREHGIPHDVGKHSVREFDSAHTVNCEGVLFDHLGVIDFLDRRFVFSRGIGLVGYYLPMKDLELRGKRNARRRCRSSDFQDRGILHRLVYCRIVGDHTTEFLNDSILRQDADGRLYLVE